MLRRDDPIPAPWTKQGKIRMAQLGLELIVSGMKIIKMYGKNKLVKI